ncbi:MAG: flagellar biosynthetic protein FliO [Methylococcaceae bacterium]|jgi:flagellar protein FliO/FliZ
MLSKLGLIGTMLCWASLALAEPVKPHGIVSASDVASWGLGLLLVLSVIGLMAWALRKFSGLAVNNTGKMHIVSALPLGAREKVILLQVGKKQLLLAVTSARIETLQVLEGDDCLRKSAPEPMAEPAFAQKLMQAIAANQTKGRHDA